MAESICRSCFHSYVCEQFNEHKESDNNKCHFFNDHYVSTADVVEVRHGVWIEHQGAYNRFECGECGNYEFNHSPYCPNCGAKMDGKGDVVTCLNCKHLMFSDMYGECNKQLRIVNPSDTCEYAEPKERGGDK